MINKFLQFIKKQRLAIRLARFDCLFVIAGLQTFKYALPLARLFRRRLNGDNIQHLHNFLIFSQNPLLFALYEEAASRQDIFATPVYVFPVSDKRFAGDLLYCLAADSEDKKFYLSLFREIVRRDYPELRAQYKVFERRLDTVYDMRFRASEMELLCEASAGFSGFCPYEVDWLKTTKNKLYLCFDVPARSKRILSAAEQENLSRLFAYLFFEKSLFVSYWRSLCTGDNSRVSFLDFDAVYPVTPELKNYLLNFVGRQQKPARPEEYKLQRAVMVLQDFCPDINVFAAWSDYLNLTDFSSRVHSDNDNLLAQLKSGGLDLGQYRPVELRSPEELAYLLETKDLKKGAQFRKSSVIYWGPMAVLFYVLLNYF